MTRKSSSLPSHEHSVPTVNAHHMNVSSSFVSNPSLPMSSEGRKAVKDKQKDDQKSPKSKEIRTGQLEMMQRETTPFKKVGHVSPPITPTCLGKYHFSLIHIFSLYLLAYKEIISIQLVHTHVKNQSKCHYKSRDLHNK